MTGYETESPKYTTLYSPVEFAKFETSIGVYSPNCFNELLLDPGSTQYRFSNQVQEDGSIREKHGLLTTTKDNPAVLVESNASFCSIMLTADSDGNASVLHTFLVSPNDVDEFEFSSEFDTQIIEYRRSVREHIKKEKIIQF